MEFLYTVKRKYAVAISNTSQCSVGNRLINLEEGMREVFFFKVFKLEK